MRDPGPFLVRMRERYGDVVRFRGGPLKGYVVAHPRDVEYVLEENIDNYPHGAWLTRKVAATIGQSVFGFDGDVWRRHRAMVEPLVAAGARRRVAEITGDEAQRTAERWDRLADRGDVVDVRAEMEQLDVAVAGRTIFGDDWERERRLLTATRRLFIEEAGRELVSPFGLIPHTVPTPFNRRFVRIRAAYERFAQDAIERRRAGGGEGDLLAGLVAARDPESGVPMDDAVVRGHAAALLFLWQPTAITLTWVWYRLARSPEAGDRLRAELRDVLAGRLPTLDDLDRLRWTSMVIDETIRVHQPGILQPREALRDDGIGGFVVPAGTRVVLVPYVTNRHPEFWDRPEDFAPERFEDPKVANRPAHALFRFGDPAPRRCIGYHLALTELPIALAILAARFRTEAVSPDPPPTRFSVAVDLPKGLPMRVRRA